MQTFLVYRQTDKQAHLCEMLECYSLGTQQAVGKVGKRKISAHLLVFPLVGISGCSVFALTAQYHDTLAYTLFIFTPFSSPLTPAPCTLPQTHCQNHYGDNLLISKCVDNVWPEVESWVMVAGEWGNVLERRGSTDRSVLPG